MIAEVVLNSVTKATDSIYHYEIPAEMEDVLSVGMRVTVGFGKGNRPKEAYVVGIVEKSEYPSLKKISEIIDTTVYFDEKSVELAKFMKHRYFCSFAQALRAMLPAGINSKYTALVFLEEKDKALVDEAVGNSLIATSIVEELSKKSPLSREELVSLTGRTNIIETLAMLEKKKIVRIENKRSENIKDTYATFVSLAIDRTDAFEICDILSTKAPARARCLEALCDNDTWLLGELTECADVSKSVVDALVEKGYAVYTKEIVRTEVFTGEALKEVCRYPLTDEQSNAYDVVSKSMEKGKCETFLIHGVTGSGKTLVYLELIEKALSMDTQAIMLVPEISLTPQMVSQVMSRFSDRVAVLHSSLTVKERYNEWKKIKEGRVDVAVGARSAVFAPFSKLGLIIIDEEHETTYKSESAPRYNALEIARFRAKQHSCALVLASATPSVESYYKTQSGKYTLIEMKKRVGDVSLPAVSVVDMRAELEQGNMSIFSRPLTDKIKKNIKDKKHNSFFKQERIFQLCILQELWLCGALSPLPRFSHISQIYGQNGLSLLRLYDKSAPAVSFLFR